ncbi:MAG TPA: TadE/TadG family type IV pilus assembly protein [Gallionellaceae bacterium]
MNARQNGVAMVEFALTLPLLLLLTMITTEFGRAIYQYNTIVKSVRSAARYLSIQTPNSALIADPAAIAAATNLVVYGTPSGTGTPLVPGLTVSNVPTPTWQTTGSMPLINTVTIKVSGYTFKPLVTGVFGTVFGNITFHDISATMRCPS